MAFEATRDKRATPGRLQHRPANWRATSHSSRTQREHGFRRSTRSFLSIPKEKVRILTEVRGNLFVVEVERGVPSLRLPRRTTSLFHLGLFREDQRTVEGWR